MCRGKEQLYLWGNISMPGIVGIISPRPPERCQRLVEQMIALMLHEPSYTCGTHSDVQLQIYGGWVAHQNSFAAQQVFTNPSGDITLLFSGECFSDEAMWNATSSTESEKEAGSD